jgi:prophage regulatory protein
MPDAETARRRFMKISDVVSETSLSRATIYRLIAKGNFPTPVKVSSQRVAWPESAVHAWMNQQVHSTPS